MQDLVLLLPCRQSISIVSITDQLVHHRGLCIVCPDRLVFDHDLVDLALIDESLILVVSDLPLLAILELFPCLVLHHGGIGVQVLSLQFYLLQLLSQSLIFFPLLFLLLVDLLVDL